jgi:hypothetical protein
MRKLAGRIFNSQKLCKEWVKTELERMVHTTTKEDKDLLHEIIKGHPDQALTKGVTDFSVYYHMNHIAMDIWKEEIREPISWVKCATGRQETPHNLLTKALRDTVEYQIKEFKKKVPQFCEECGTHENLQVDHIIMFKDLVKEFNRNRIPPIAFIEKEHRLSFHDKEYENEWVTYHKNEATLRILCQKHNLMRNYNG